MHCGIPHLSGEQTSGANKNDENKHTHLRSHPLLGTERVANDDNKHADLRMIMIIINMRTSGAIHCGVPHASLACVSDVTIPKSATFATCMCMHVCMCACVTESGRKGGREGRRGEEGREGGGDKKCVCVCMCACVTESGRKGGKKGETKSVRVCVCVRQEKTKKGEQKRKNKTRRGNQLGREGDVKKV